MLIAAFMPCIGLPDTIYELITKINDRIKEKVPHIIV